MGGSQSLSAPAHTTCPVWASVSGHLLVALQVKLAESFKGRIPSVAAS